MAEQREGPPPRANLMQSRHGKCQWDVWKRAGLCPIKSVLAERTEILDTSDAPLSSIKGGRLPFDSTAGGSTGRKTGRRGRARERCRPRVVIVRGCVVLAGGASLRLARVESHLPLDQSVPRQADWCDEQYRCRNSGRRWLIVLDDQKREGQLPPEPIGQLQRARTFSSHVDQPVRAPERPPSVHPAGSTQQMQPSTKLSLSALPPVPSLSAAQIDLTCLSERATSVLNDRGVGSVREEGIKGI
jgi:hypothetical protein